MNNTLLFTAFLPFVVIVLIVRCISPSYLYSTTSDHARTTSLIDLRSAFQANTVVLVLVLRVMVRSLRSRHEDAVTIRSARSKQHSKVSCFKLKVRLFQTLFEGSSHSSSPAWTNVGVRLPVAGQSRHTRLHVSLHHLQQPPGRRILPLPLRPQSRRAS